MLKNQYESVYSDPVNSMKVTDPSSFFNTSEAEEILDNAVFNRDDILEALDKLSSNSAPGLMEYPLYF